MGPRFLGSTKLFAALLGPLPTSTSLRSSRPRDLRFPRHRSPAGGESGPRAVSKRRSRRKAASAGWSGRLSNCVLGPERGGDRGLRGDGEVGRVASPVSLGLEPDTPLARDGRCHQLADGVEDHLELRVVLLLKGDHLAGEVLVGRQDATEPNKRADDLDVHLHGSFAMKHARKHRDAVLREGIRRGPATAPRS